MVRESSRTNELRKMIKLFNKVILHVVRHVKLSQLPINDIIKFYKGSELTLFFKSTKFIIKLIDCLKAVKKNEQTGIQDTMMINRYQYLLNNAEKMFSHYHTENNFLTYTLDCKYASNINCSSFVAQNESLKVAKEDAKLLVTSESQSENSTSMIPTCGSHSSYDPISLRSANTKPAEFLLPESIALYGPRTCCIYYYKAKLVREIARLINERFDTKAPATEGDSANLHPHVVVATEDDDFLKQELKDYSLKVLQMVFYKLGEITPLDANQGYFSTINWGKLFGVDTIFPPIQSVVFWSIQYAIKFVITDHIQCRPSNQPFLPPSIRATEVLENCFSYAEHLIEDQIERFASTFFEETANADSLDIVEDLPDDYTNAISDNHFGKFSISAAKVEPLPVDIPEDAEYLSLANQIAQIKLQNEQKKIQIDQMIQKRSELYKEQTKAALDSLLEESKMLDKLLAAENQKIVDFQNEMKNYELMKAQELQFIQARIVDESSPAKLLSTRDVQNIPDMKTFLEGVQGGLLSNPVGMPGNIDNGYSVIPIRESSIQTESPVEVQPAIVGDSENIKMTEQLNGEMPIAISSIQKPSVVSLQPAVLDKKNDVNAQSNSAALSLALDSDSNTVSEITEAEPIFVTSHIDLKETEQKLNAETEIEADIEEEIEESHSEIDQLPSKADNSVVEIAFLDQSILNITKPAVNDETLQPDQSIVNSAKEEAKEETPLEIQNMETQIVQTNFEDTTKISITLKSPSISNSANEIEEDIKIELNKDTDSFSKKLGDSISSPAAHAAVEVPIVSHSENVKNTQVTKPSKIPAHLIDKIQDDIFAGLFTPDIPPVTALNFESPLVEMKAIVDKKDNSLSNSLGLSNIESNSFGLSNIESNATKVYSPSHSILADNARKPKVNYSEEIEDERLYALQLITRKLYGILPRDALHIAAPAIEWESFLDIKEVSRSVINLISCSIQEAMESLFEKHNKYAAYSENKFLIRPIQPKPISTDELIEKCHRTVEQWIKDTTRAKNPADILVAEAVKSHGRKLCDMTQDKATLLSKIEQSIWDSLMDDTVDTVMQLYAEPEYEGTNDAIDESLLKQVNDSNTSAKLVELSAASLELDALCVLESVMEKLGILVPLDMQHNQVPNINWETMFAFDHVNPLIVSLISTSIQDSMESQLQIHQEYLAKKRTGGRRRSCPPVAISTSQLLSQCFEHSTRAIKAAFQNSLL